MRRGRIFELCKVLLKHEDPNFEFTDVQVNKFRHHEECCWHRDGNNGSNTGTAFARVGNCSGGGLEGGIDITRGAGTCRAS